MVVLMHRRALLRITKRLPRSQPRPQVPHPLPIEMARAAQWFHAVSDTTRLAILEFLAHREGCVNELQRFLDVPQSNISFHVGVLKESGLVREQREGRWRYYSVRRETIDDMIAFTRVITRGMEAGTCAPSCFQRTPGQWGPLTYQEKLIRYGP